MVNFRDPIVIARETDEVDKFWSFVGGIFVWEFLITLDYEWNIIRGNRPYGWTIWVYSLTRVATLATVALNMFNVDATSQIDCQVTADLQFIFAYLALATSSLLMVIRIIAIWDRKRIIVAFVTGVWGINIAFLIQGVLRFRSSWGVNTVSEGCVFYLDSIRLSTVVGFVTDTILLFFMLFGLYRLRRRGGGLMALGRLLWNQGVVWLLLAVVAELTPMVFILLNLNQILNLTFQVPWVISMSIASTRMYRSLSNFLSPGV
ncbi:hypothetical protein BGY98DRAFT_96042 [Russula aff. rugulosa BPL654]|nr:hypothetical protein BGY98DRAFT_96042 [Russula aff. rugulosa BPL654]